MKRMETDVVVVGGGATGTGVIRDCALRGMACVMIEKNDLASGTTGRNHGLLHSGARYAVNDPESAAECISENRILKRIARHCVEDTGGLFVTLPDDDTEYHKRLVKGCRAVGIDYEEIDVSAALKIEPNLNSGVLTAMKVPDGTIDPFRLAASNVLDAKEHGAEIRTHTEMVRCIISGDRVVGVLCRDNLNGELFEIYSKIVINASGVWGRRICETAGVPLTMYPSKGSLVIIDYRVNNVVINCCRKPFDGDIIVPGDTVSLIGTTSKKIDYDRIEELDVDDDEIEVLLAGGEKLIPNVSRTRVLRAYSGVRPLVSRSGDVDGRDITRGIVLIDHEAENGVKGFITVTGGKLMTYRLMAEWAVDLACEKLRVDVPCTTHERPLPGSETPSNRPVPHYFDGISKSVLGSAHYRHGERMDHIFSKDKKSYGLVCECEMVTAGEVEYALKNLCVKDMIDLRRRTRLGMGPCQGELCSYRTAGLFNDLGAADEQTAIRMLKDFFEERWKGVKPVLWGDTLREIEFTYWIYQGLFGLGGVPDEDEPI